VLRPVSVVRCESYDPAFVHEKVRASLAPLGGMAAFVKPGQRVLVKPNLLKPTPPEAAITTHPAVVEVVVRLVEEAGGRPFIADTPGADTPSTPASLRRLYRATGLLALAESMGVELAYDVSGVALPNPGGRLVKRLEVIRPAVEADVIIALPKLKTHVLTTLTGATKIMFGVVPGLAKPGCHASYHDLDLFGDFLLDLLVGLPPALFVMDGVLAMEGDGPGKSGRPRRLDVLLAGADAVAVDLVACRLTGIDPERVPPLRAARRRGWWDGDPASAPTFGDYLPALAVRDFALPTSVGAAGQTMLPYPRLTRPLATGLLAQRPTPLSDRCTGCGSCARACPVGGIVIRGRLAVVDQGRCIHCYCCHELCPEAAIDLRLSPAGALFQRLVGQRVGGPV
jgi:uncharacterized protein (DUF362 family)/NAD-dependent dihydropyrimidine dehydrogenase PreA subunit